MSIDWDGIFKGAVAAGANAVKSSAPQVKDFLQEVLRGHQRALEQLGAAFAIGDLSKATFEAELDDEAETLRIELEAVTVLTKAIARRAINAFRKAFIDGLTAAVKAAL